VGLQIGGTSGGTLTGGDGRAVAQLRAAAVEALAAALASLASLTGAGDAPGRTDDPDTAAARQHVVDALRLLSDSTGGS
jgi:hypothetical protein